jgi:hypothetical protein
MWERIKGVGKNYNPELDTMQKIEDMREEWAGKERLRRQKEAGGEPTGFEDLDDEEWNDQVHAYFRETTDAGRLSPEAKGQEKGSPTPPPGARLNEKVESDGSLS